MPDRPVLANNTPLVAFWTVSKLGILKALFNEVLIPPAVNDEFLAFEKESRQKMLAHAPWIKVVPLDNPTRSNAFAGLDRGEAEVLALAEEQNPSLVLIDERKGRQFAKRLGLPLSGTVGVLLLAKEKGLLTAIMPVLSAIQDAGLYFDVSLIEKVRQTAGEK